ncbi:short-chain dehydrogenase [Dacryopinax primogenitus]|uniref:Short-chain dehydrogenase n=1 Tax=Dacryopinax primogenitus (strain DJM 731) TaxID=1858805 RepID=M5FYE5_DACPD|nr:short-chain dehydrogenase [Dacryopinax primogenitus]EJT98571.1 short-chain dehydrogenase [Dacryopinax primogenitus]
MSSTPEEFSVANLFNLKGKIALVTGGGTGIGLMISQGLAANGAIVYVGSRRKEVVEKVSGPFGAGEIRPLVLDVTDKESILSAVAFFERAHSKLDFLVNNAGQVGPTSDWFTELSAPEQKEVGNNLFKDQSLEAWASHWQANVGSIFFVTTAFLELLKKAYIPGQGDGYVERWSPSVVNITSISGIMKLAQDHFCYNAAKAAANHLTLMLSTELALRRVLVRVNAIAPGVYGSEMTSGHTNGHFTAAAANAVGKGLTPLPSARGGTDREIAGTVLYLVSPSGFYTNGQIIAVDGGFVATNP